MRRAAAIQRGSDRRHVARADACGDAGHQKRPEMDRLPSGLRPPLRIIAANSSADWPASDGSDGLGGPAVHGGDLEHEEDVAAQLQQGLEVALQHGLLLRLAHRPLVYISPLVGLEARAVGGAHQGHAEPVQMTAFDGAIAGEDVSAGMS